jgi:hypothetical protein
MEFWHVVTIVLAAAVIMVGIINMMFWLVAVGFVLLPIAAVWGLVATGPGSPYNPYEHH